MFGSLMAKSRLLPHFYRLAHLSRYLTTAEASQHGQTAVTPLRQVCSVAKVARQTGRHAICELARNRPLVV